MSVGRLWAIVLVTVMVLSIGLIPAAVYGSRPEPGIYLDLRVYSITNSGLADITQDLRNQRGVVTCVFVDLVEPGQAVPVASKCFEGVPAVFIPYKLLEPGLRKWWRTLNSSKVPLQNIRTTEVGLMVRVRIYDAVNGKEIFYGLNSLPIPLDLFEKPRALQYTLALRKEISQLVPIERKEIIFMPSNVESIEKDSTKQSVAPLVKAQSYSCTPYESQPGWRCGCVYIEEYGCSCTCYKRVAVVTPEILQQQGVLPPNYFKVGGDGLLYIATPILIIDNTQNKGFIWARMYMNRDAKLELRLSFSTDKVLPEALQGKAPSINIQLGGATFGGEYYYAHDLLVCPGTARWAYIWARPIFEWESMYECSDRDLSVQCVSRQLRCVRDDIMAYISNVPTSGPRILGGTFDGLPADTLMNVFFKGVNITYVRGPYGPGTSCLLPWIFKSRDVCGSGFGVGVPVGAIAATGICAVVSATLGGLPAAACPAITATASGFQVLLGYEPANIYIDGEIENSGAVNFGYACPTQAQDVTVYMYFATSRFSYVQQPPWCPWCSPCYYKVPAGIYVKIVSAS